MGMPDHVGPDHEPRRRRPPPDPEDVARADETIPRADHPDGVSRVTVDAEVWLWHVAYERRRAPDLQALLVEEYTPYAYSLARRSHRGQEPIEDLRQVAIVGLISALDRFRCERGIPFPGFATPTILGTLKRHHRDNDWAMRIPRQAHTVAMALADAEARLAARSRGSDATRGDLAAELGIDEADLIQAQAALLGRRVMSLDAPANEAAGALLDVAVTDDGYGRAESRADLRAALRSLSPRDRSTLAKYYLDGLSQLQISSDLGVSQMQVSRTLRSALRRLAARMADDERVASAHS